MGTIQIQNLTFGYPDQETPLLSDLSVSFDARWHLGLVGRNGRGKTTLLHLLMGDLQASQGTITTDLTFHYFPQPLPTNADTMAVSDVLLAISAAEPWQWQVEMQDLGLPLTIMDQPFGTLSGGEQTKVLLAELFSAPDGFALIDEPTNHLDEQGRTQTARYLRQKQGFIVVSHDPSFLDDTTDHTLAIEKKQVSLYQGNYSVWHREKAVTDTREAEQQGTLKKEIKRLTVAERQREAWSNKTEAKVSAAADRGFVSHKSAKMMRKAKNIERRNTTAIADKEALLKNVDDVEPLSVPYTPWRESTVLRTNAVAVHLAGRQLFQPVSFVLQRGDRLQIQGPNGIGKSSLIHALLGQLPAIDVSGSFQVPQGVTFSYLPQTFADPDKLMTVVGPDALKDQMILYWLHKMGMPRPRFLVPVQKWSMGEKKKLLLAYALQRPGNVLIWDEPTNYLDVDTRDQLLAGVQKSDATMIIIDHDRQFTDAVCNRQLALIR
ncbi:MAG: ATP-binding cassette domain-containing protein [Schleiferilactobacillus harbinensis]|jgi:lincosamide and streptogramin A transport system ATP-binding/permease protein|nr:ATP-binding cassette domain-containing protein [Schleiferilactobacillus harbinensis]MCI1913308.1 ATP-binding cassette domain-containing protein [Schleiferilactobacillus harbinensis]